MLRKKLSKKELQLIGIAISPLFIALVILLTQHIHVINKTSALELQISLMHSEPLFPVSTIKAKMMHVETNIALLDKILSSPKIDATTVYVWHYTRKILGELGTNLISFSPKERFMIIDLNEHLKGTQSVNRQNLEVLLSYQDYLIASFASYVSLQ
ncbi:MAG: hypothetical protein U9Q12_00205 [Patescibacteria group bacterium]|nr:hypothetical protein [Patescibacteria group bacterium]